MVPCAPGELVNNDVIAPLFGRSGHALVGSFLSVTAPKSIGTFLQFFPGVLLLTGATAWASSTYHESSDQSGVLSYYHCARL